MELKEMSQRMAYEWLSKGHKVYLRMCNNGVTLYASPYPCTWGRKCFVLKPKTAPAPEPGKRNA